MRKYFIVLKMWMQLWGWPSIEAVIANWISVMIVISQPWCQRNMAQQCANPMPPWAFVPLNEAYEAVHWTAFHFAPLQTSLLFSALYFIALNCVPLYCSVFMKYYFIHSLHFQSWHFFLMLLAILDSYGSHCSIAHFLAGFAAFNCISFHLIAFHCISAAGDTW